MICTFAESQHCLLSFYSASDKVYTLLGYDAGPVYVQELVSEGACKPAETG